MLMDLNLEQTLADALGKARDLEAIVNHSRSVVMRWRVAPDFPIEYVTQNVAQFGFDPVQLMSCDVYWTDRLHPDDAEHFEEQLNAFLAADVDEYVLEYRILDRNNTVRWVTDRSHAFRDEDGKITGYVSVIVDISERMQRERELELLAATSAALGKVQHKAQILATILSASCQAFDTDTAAIASTAADGSLLHVDLGSGEWAPATGAWEPVEGGIGGMVLTSRQPYVSDDIRSHPLLVHPELVHRSVAAACVPLLSSEVAIGVLAVGRAKPLTQSDVRLLATLGDMAASALDRVAVLATLEQRVAERTQDLLEANLRLERLAHHKDEFLATMSHELRTPLTAVLGLSEALDTGVYGDVNERQSRAIQVILQSGRHLLHLINDLLDLSRIEAGHLELQLEPCYLNLVCQSCISLLGEIAKSKGQQIILNAPHSVILLADTRRLHQLLLNLLSNASKFTPEGGAIYLHLQADAEAQTVTVEVADTGIGISPEDQERIFEPFVQLDSRLSRQYAGTGLGLALVKRIATLHGGDIVVVSQPEQGSRFVVTLPWRKPPAA
jgi:PAS domain S-box-containing protein